MIIFPKNIIANATGFTRAELFTIDDSPEKAQNVKLDM